tara:strand:+ start:44 stop:364 length:321 start_codon:yes stop_codon:yes gene_type:complete
MSYSNIKKYNWTYFAETILKALTGKRSTYLKNVAAGQTLELDKYSFKSISIMNTHAANSITIQNATQTLTVPASTTVNFDALNGAFQNGELKVATGTGTAIIAGVY